MKRKLETKRLILRGPAPEDVDALLEIRNSPYVMEYNVMEPVTREQLLKTLEKDAASEKALYLELKETGAAIGAVWLAEDSLRYGVNALMLEYQLGEAYAGRGYMTEALEAAVQYAFEALGAELVSARVFEGNAGSRRVLEKLGLVREGTLRRAVKGYGGRVHNDMLFSMLKEEYAEKHGVPGGTK